jgi:hypothetical protein
VGLEWSVVEVPVSLNRRTHPSASMATMMANAAVEPVRIGYGEEWH